MERWVDIKGFEGLYQISDHGNVMSLPKKCGNCITSCKVLKLSTFRTYLLYSLYKDKKQNFRKAHRLVAEHFLDNPLKKPCVNHKDSNKHNNHFSNLEWCTHSENSSHSYLSGRQKRYPMCSIKLHTDKNNRIGRHKLVIDLYTGIFYNSVKEAAFYKGINYWDLQKDLNERINSYGIMYSLPVN